MILYLFTPLMVPLENMKNKMYNRKTYENCIESKYDFKDVEQEYKHLKKGGKW